MVENTLKDLSNGQIVSDAQFQNFVNGSAVVEAIDWKKWTNKDCVVTDLDLPNESKGKFARTIEHILTDEECKALVEATEKIGYEPALVNIGNGKQILDIDYRKNSRVIVDSVPVTDIIWERLKPYLPDIFPKQKFIGGWNPHVLNERLRFLRYGPGDFFKGHMDGTFRKRANETTDGLEHVSKVTLQLYLNEGFKGGATTFLGKPELPCVPKTGMALIFQHDIHHEGSLLEKGTKYAVRTDLMYVRKPEE